MTTTLKWIGTGSGLNPLLGNTSFTVDCGGARTLLVDCGTAVPTRLLELGTIGAISDIAVTHLHADHVGGLEALGFFNHFGLERRGNDRPHLHLASDELAQELWLNTLKGGMGPQQDENGNAFDATLETYFQVHAGTKVGIPGLPGIEFFPTLHVAGMENYGIRLHDRAVYSGDTVELPPHDPDILFQDCRFGEPGPGEIHITYTRLHRELPPHVKKRTHLVHLDTGYEEYQPERDGFAGFVMPGQEFAIE